MLKQITTVTVLLFTLPNVNPKLPVKAHPYAFKPVEKQIFANASVVVSSKRTKCSIPVA